MKISIVGGGNMGGNIAYGLTSENIDLSFDITVINRSQEKTDLFHKKSTKINTVTNDYSSLATADIILLAIKPWLIEAFIEKYRELFHVNQIIISIAAGISLDDLSKLIPENISIFRVMPNTAIAIKESMTFITTNNGTEDQKKSILNIFSVLGKAQYIEEKLFGAVASLTSCGIAFAMKYIRASMEGAIEMGIKADEAKLMIIQTLKGAANLLEHNGTHPEEEIDKVSTPGGVTIKGINEMEHAGFSSAIIKALKASLSK